MTPTSGVEFLVWLLIVAAIIAMFASAYESLTRSLSSSGGVLLGALHIPLPSPLQPGHRPDWLTPDVILILFLPALIFEGSVKLDVRELLRNSVPLLLLANAGVLMAIVCDRLPCALAGRHAVAHLIALRLDYLCNGPHFSASDL